jgi:hypothetical protein
MQALALQGQGMFNCWQYGYDNVIDNVRHGIQPSQPLSPSSYIRLLTKPSYTVHIRPVLMVGHAHARKAHVVAFEGHLTDFVNGLNLELPASGPPGRTPAVVASFPAAVPPDMRNVPYKPLNLAHQLKQGTMCANPPCSMIGHGCDHGADTGTWQLFQLEGELFFGSEVAYHAS